MKYFWSVFLVLASVSILSPTSGIAQSLQPMCWQVFSDLEDKPHSVGEALSLLKLKPRQGWLDRGVPVEIAETVWQHSIKVARAARIYFERVSPREVPRAVFLAMSHDMAEYLVPDFTPADNIPKALKRALEAEAMNLLESSGSMAAENIRAAWWEYELASTPLARRVKDIDKIDFGLQAMVYSLQGYDFSDLTGAVPERVVTEELSAIYAQLLARFHAGLVTDPYAEYFEMLQNGI